VCDVFMLNGPRPKREDRILHMRILRREGRQATFGHRHREISPAETGALPASLRGLRIRDRENDTTSRRLASNQYGGGPRQERCVCRETPPFEGGGGNWNHMN
jgi:hypothetical protein